MQGAINLPVADTFAIRGAFSLVDRNSYYNDVGPYHNEAGSLNELDGRLGVLWKPNNNFQVLFKTEHSDKNTGGFAFRPVPTTAYASGRTSDIRTLNYDTPTKNTERQWLNSLELRFALDNGTVFRFLAGYQDKKVFNLTDTDGTAINVGPGTLATSQVQNVRERVFTRELNIISPTDGQFNWVVGGYYQHNLIDVLNLNYTAPQFYTTPGATFQRVYIPTDKLVGGLFAQGGMKVTNDLEVTLGVRQSGFKGKQTEGAGVYAPSGARQADLVGQHDDNATTGKLSVNWKLTPDHLLYAFVARGYKPGGFSSASSEFDPEFVVDTEIGWKATMLDNHLRTSVNLFNYDYQNFQAQVIDLGSGQNNVTNVTDAKVRGAEFELQGIVGNWKIDGGLSYVHSEMGSVTFVDTRNLPAPGAPRLGPQCTVTITTGCFDYTPYLVTNTGGVNLYSPKLTYNAGIEYRWPFAGGSSLTPRLNYAYISEQYLFLQYNPARDRLAPRGLLSAQLTYETGQWQAQVYGTNLADKEYVAGQLGNNEFYGAPREFGLRLSTRF